MDLKLLRPQTVCATTGRTFAAGEAFYSALIRDRGSISRIDVAADAWQGPPDHVIAWWRSRFPDAGAAAPAVAPPDVLLDALETLEDGSDAPLRYLLALQLVRRRLLKIVEEPEAAADGTLTFACRKRDREYRVAVVGPAEAAAAGVEERLAALLWSGDAA